MDAEFNNLLFGLDHVSFMLYLNQCCFVLILTHIRIHSGYNYKCNLQIPANDTMEEVKAIGAMLQYLGQLIAKDTESGQTHGGNGMSAGNFNCSLAVMQELILFTAGTSDLESIENMEEYVQQIKNAVQV